MKNPFDINGDGKVDHKDAAALMGKAADGVKDATAAVGNATVAMPAKVWAKFVMERGLALAKYVVMSRFGMITISTTLAVTILGGYLVPFVSYADAFFVGKWIGLVAGVIKS